MTAQLRGEALCARIRDVITELAADAAAEKRPFVYNASLVAARVPASRTTLRRYEDVISAVLKKLKAGRRASDGESTLAKLTADNERLRQRQIALEQEVTSLRRHHVEIYRQFQLYSVDVTPLIRPILDAQCQEAGHCGFCGSVWPETLAAKSNVVALKDRKGPRQ